MKFNRFDLLRSALFATAVAVLTSSASAQYNWPLPESGGTTTCTGFSCSNPNWKTVGYPTATLAFGGRYIDAVDIFAYNGPFRTAYARGMRIATINGKQRAYFMVGSSIGAYDLNTFMSRMAAREPLMPATQVQTSLGNGRPFGVEYFLAWDKYFYPEWRVGCPSPTSGQEVPAGCWKTTIEEGNDRLMAFDWDDEGYLYAAFLNFGWGIVKDDLGSDRQLMTSLHQQFPAPGAAFPASITHVKRGSDGWVFVGFGINSGLQVWKVTQRTAPVAGPSSNAFTAETILTTSSDEHTAIKTGNGAIRFHTTDNLIAGQFAAAQTFDSLNYKTLDTDGSSFYSLHRGGPSGWGISVFSWNGSAWTEKTYAIGASYVVPQSLRVGPNGLVAAGGAETDIGWNVRVYKLDSATLTATEIPFNTTIPGAGERPFFAAYYGGAAPEGYRQVGKGYTLDTALFNHDGKTWLALGAYGAGDLWQIKAGDSLNASLKTPAPIYHGDTVTFTSSLSSGKPVSVRWNFGDGDVTQPRETLAGASPDISHRYNAAATPSTYSAVATNMNDGTMVADPVQVSLAVPQVSFGVNRTGGPVFTSSSPSSTALILPEDNFIDLSQGAAGGHTVSWSRSDPSATTPVTGSTNTMAVGGCGNHTVTFKTAYGPNALPLPAGGITVGYTVRAITASIKNPTIETGGSGCSSNTVRFTADIRKDASITAVEYDWKLMSGSSIVAQSTSEVFNFCRNLLATGQRVTLTVRAIGGVASTTCAQNNTHTAAEFPIAEPNITGLALDNANNCRYTGQTCKVNMLVGSGQALDGLNCTWTTKRDNATIATTGPAACSQNLFVNVPGLVKNSSYSVSLSVTNGVFSKDVSIGFPTACTTCSPAIPGTITDPPCNTEPSNDNFTISYVGQNGVSCTPSSCPAGTSIYFYPTPSGWTIGDCETFLWEYPGGTETTKTLIRTFNTSGSVSLTITNPFTRKTGKYTVTVNIGTTGGGGTGGGGTGGGGTGGGACQSTPNDGNTAINAIPTQTTGGCRADAACLKNEQIIFSPSIYGWSKQGCETYLWDFGDGTQSSLEMPSKSFPNDGTYRVTLRLTGSTVANVYRDVVVGTGVNGGGGTGGGGTGGGGTGGSGGSGSCQAMTAESNVYITYQGPTSNCQTNQAAPCAVNEQIQFTAYGYYYSFDNASCPHTFLWSFDDGTTSTERNPKKAFAGGRTYRVSLKITRAGTQPQEVTVYANVPVSGACTTKPTASNTTIAYDGGTTHCSSVAQGCNANETIQFRAVAAGYTFSGCETYTWNFGDSTPTSTAAQPSHSFANPGTYMVTLTIKGETTAVIKNQVQIGKPRPRPNRRSY